MPDFSLIAKFGMDATGVKTELKQLRAETNDFVNEWGKLGLAAGAAAFVALSKGAIDLASHLTDTSTNLGINVVSLQALEAQHKRNGVSQEGLLKALEKTKEAVISAAEGDAKANAALAKLHLTAQQLIALPLDKQYEAIAKAAKNSTDQATAYSAVSDLLGSKVAPKLMASLKELATDGLAKVTKEAQEAGQVMSGSTIAALDRAGDAIDDFKKKITVAVGEIIVNFRTKEGLELMLFQFMKVVGQFGAGILDAITEAGGMVWAVMKGAFLGVSNYFQDALVSVVEAIATAINKILPARFEINVGNLEAFRSSGKGIADEITEAIALTRPSTFKKEVGDYWDGLIKDQHKIVDDLNKVEFKKELKELAGAAKPIKTALVEGAQAVTKAAEDLKEAAHAVMEIQRTGKSYADQSTTSLQGVMERLNKQLNSVGSQGTQIKDANMNTNYGDWLSAQALKAELDGVKKELAARSQFQNVYNSQGKDAALRQYGDSDYQRFTRDITEDTTRTANTLQSILSGLQKSGFVKV